MQSTHASSAMFSFVRAAAIVFNGDMPHAGAMEP
jgi:hypothetical protein